MPQLSSEDGRALLAIARQAIFEAVIDRRSTHSRPAPQSPELLQPRGAFVTLYLGRRLRGCVGRAQSPDSLAETVASTAFSAALYDSRFIPVSANEVSQLAVEISVLSDLHPIKPDAIEPGKHGLVVASGEKRGLLLPQVAAERRWSASRFLAETCRKAGLDPEAWHDPQTQLFGFTVEVFSEPGLASYSTST